MLKTKDMKPKYRYIMPVLMAVVLLISGCLPRILSNLLVHKAALPIMVENAPNIGSLHFELIYDTDNLKVLSVEQGPLSAGSLFDYNMDYPGQVVFGIANPDGISGDGELAIVTFSVKGSNSNPIPINLENVFVFDAESLDPVVLDASSGSITPRGTGYEAPAIVFTQD